MSFLMGRLALWKKKRGDSKRKSRSHPAAVAWRITPSAVIVPVAARTTRSIQCRRDTESARARRSSRSADAQGTVRTGSGVDERPARPHVERRVGRRFGDAALPAHRRGERDHGAVVGAERQLRKVDPGVALFALQLQALA